MVDLKSPTTPYMANIQPLSEEQYAEVLKKYGATESSLKSDLVTIREWLSQQPHLPTLGEEHDPFLKRYLIASKNSLQRCKEFLETYFVYRTRFPLSYFIDHIEIDRMFSYVKSTILPKPTPEGSRVIITRYEQNIGNDPSLMDWAQYYTLATISGDLMLAADRHPVDTDLVIDLGFYSVGLNNTYIANIMSFRHFIEASQGAIPLHYKTLHIVNAPGFIATVITLVRPFLKDKLGERIVVHKNLESLHERIPKEMLPSNYGGDMPQTLEELCDEVWYKVIVANVPWIESRRWLASDESKRIGGSKTADEFGVEGSFRKLAVD